jgi:hypothetical protein
MSDLAMTPMASLGSSRSSHDLSMTESLSVLIFLRPDLCVFNTKGEKENLLPTRTPAKFAERWDRVT